MKSPRLLPIVIFAASALLLFKGAGLLTGGGYVLTGTQPAVAAEATPAAAAPGAAAAASPDGAGSDGGGAENGPTLADTSPMLADNAPTVAIPADPAKASGSPEAAPGKPAPPPPSPGSIASLTAAGVLPGADTPGLPVCPPAPADSASAGSADTSAGKAPTPGVNCDAAAAEIGPNGKPVPIGAAAGAVSPTEQKLIDRLNERSAALDKLAASLEMRQAVVEAAEKQMQARADALKSLQEQIQALQDQKKSIQDSQFASVVKMYETMKPQQAAAIFDGLDMGVLIRVAEAMDPRKMSPILAQMASARAQQLTAQMAAQDGGAGDGPAAAADPNALPQIVGH